MDYIVTKAAAVEGETLSCPHCPKKFIRRHAMETHVKLKHDARTLELLKKHSLDYDRQGRRLPSANAIRKRAEQNSPRVLACARLVTQNSIHFL